LALQHILYYLLKQLRLMLLLTVKYSALQRNEFQTRRRHHV
jgi:hypothetical protein